MSHNDFEVNSVGTMQHLAHFRGIAKLALSALERGRSQIHGILVQQDQDFAITELRRFLKQTGESYEDMGG